MSLESGRRFKQVKYIYDLPYTERKLLCDILDINNQWERLGGTFMGFKVLDLEKMKQAEKCGDSPTDRLLQTWGHMNNTVLSLYNLLFEMQHYQAMSVLSPFVPEKYHILHLKTPFTEPPSCTHTDSASSYPVPPDTLLYKIQPQLSAPSSTNDKESSNKNLASCAANTSQPQTICKVPEMFLQDLPNQQRGSIPNASSSLISHKDVPGKVLNDHLSQRKEKLHTREENISNHQVQELKNKNILDNEYRLKALAKLDQLELRERPRERKISAESPSEKSTLPLPHLVLRTPPEVPINTATRDRMTTNNRRSLTSSCDSSSPSLPSVSYEELEKATDCWREDFLLGKGGFGLVYKGIWKNTKVAIKKIINNPETTAFGLPIHLTPSLDELHVLQKFPHPNILQVFGFSADVGKPTCLVYQFMPYGSLEDRLQCKKIRCFDETTHMSPIEVLNWKTRFNIAFGTARALQYLHTVQEKPLIHGDIKSANIFLDKNYEAKLGDFGLAREGPQDPSTSAQVSRVHGTRPYIPHEYLRNKKLSARVDSYSFGIVMFELCTGCKAYDEKKSKGKFLKDVVLETDDKRQLMDKNAQMNDGGVFEILMNLGLSCIEYIPKQRPDMTEAFKVLEEFSKLLRGKEATKRPPQELVVQFPYQRVPAAAPINAHYPSVLPQYPANGNLYATPFIIPHANPAFISYPTSPVRISTNRPPFPNPMQGLKHLPETVVTTPSGCESSLPKKQGPTPFIDQQQAISENSSCSLKKEGSAKEARLPRLPEIVGEENQAEKDNYLPLLPEIYGSKLLSEDSKVISSRGKSTFLDVEDDSDEEEEEDSDNSYEFV